MKKVEAIIRPQKLTQVRAALKEIGICQMMISEISGHGLKEGYEMIYRGTRQFIDLVSNLRIEIIIADDLVDDCLTIISQTARTGQVGDGKIFVSEVTNVVRIRTGDTDERAM